MLLLQCNWWLCIIHNDNVAPGKHWYVKSHWTHYNLCFDSHWPDRLPVDASLLWNLTRDALCFCWKGLQLLSIPSTSRGWLCRVLRSSWGRCKAGVCWDPVPKDHTWGWSRAFLEAASTRRGTYNCRDAAKNTDRGRREGLTWLMVASTTCRCNHRDKYRSHWATFQLQFYAPVEDFI